MHIVRAIKQGNSIMLSIPAGIRIELGINRADYFQVAATNPTTLQYTRMAGENKNNSSTVKSRSKKNASRKSRSKKHSR